MSAFWTALAYAIEPSDATFSASAALIGAATLALIRDIAARSGSSSPASSLSCSRVSFWNCCSSDTGGTSEVRLVDRGHLCRIRVRDRAVRKDVGGNRRVDRDREVRVHQRHRRPLGQLLARELIELFAAQLPELLLTHSFSPPQLLWSIVTDCSAFAIAAELSDSAFSATAALIGAATFAFNRDIAARSGSSSPASSFSCSRVSFWYSLTSILLVGAGVGIRFEHLRTATPLDDPRLAAHGGPRRAGLVHVRRDDRVDSARCGHAVRVRADAPLDDFPELHPLLVSDVRAGKRIVKSV